MITLKPHNQRAVDEIAAAISSGIHSVLYSSGVGTGKSFVFMGLAERILHKDQKILYIIPKYAIMENLKTYSDFQNLPTEVAFATYNFFTDYEKGMAELSKYDLIVIDEAHHLWSDKYGRAILSCMKGLPDKIFLGLTATPERSIIVDGHKEDVHTCDVFDMTVDGISNFEAIEMGLMPQFNYRILLPTKDPAQLEREYEEEYNFRVDCTDCESTLLHITKMYERKKWIAYFPNKKKLLENEEFIRKVFAGYEIFVLYSDLRNLDEVVAGMQAAKKAIVLSVDMLLEGVHLPDITGIVLFRNVTSLVTFQQILGRVCSIGNKVEPVIVDASSSGPKLLAKLIKMNQKREKSGPRERNGKTKPVMTLGIGDQKEWVGIREFLMRYAGIDKEVKYKENIERAKNKYHVLNGKVYDDEIEWKKDSLSYKKLTACAKCFEAPLSLLITTLQAELKEAA